jgi:DNA-binding PadR family transcriptional regulator
MLTQAIRTDGIESMVRRYRRGLVNSMLEYLILDNVERRDVCGYDIMSTLCVDFEVLLSPGQVYPVIDAMEESGVITKEKNGRRTSLRLTPLGRILLKAWRDELSLMQLRLSIVHPPPERVR